MKALTEIRNEAFNFIWKNLGREKDLNYLANFFLESKNITQNKKISQKGKWKIKVKNFMSKMKLT